MELIKISKHNGKQAVSARELHNFLGIGKDFSSWIKVQIDRCDLIENIDYQSFTQKGEREFGGTIRIEYALSLDAAKEVSMMSQSDKGKQARRYFIECEKKLRNAFALPQSFSEALMLAARQAEQIESQQKQLNEQEPKVLFTNAVLASKDSCLIGELAKIVSQNGFEIGQNRMFDWLRENHYLGTIGDRRNIPNQVYIEQGLFELKKGIRSGNGGVIHTTITPMVTNKGQMYFINKFLKWKSNYQKSL